MKVGDLMIKKAKKVLITGAGSGLGKEAAIALAHRGHMVYATTHYDAEVEFLNNYAKENKLNMKAFKLDILLEDDRKKILDYDIDTLIANASIGDSGSVIEVSMDRIKNCFETNVFATIELSQIFMKKLIKNQIEGRIIFISSLWGRISMPFLSPYCATKFAIEAFAESLRTELSQLPNNKIQVSLIEPGLYATGFNKINTEKKYEWMEDKSFFKENFEKIKENDIKALELFELKTYESIIEKYVKAVEDKKMKFRYTSPIKQAVMFQVARIFGV